MAEVQVHPTAIVEDGARLAAGVKIGPFCVVGPEVSLGAPQVEEVAEQRNNPQTDRNRGRQWMNRVSQDAHLSRMSFFTELTPCTERAIATALSMLAAESTKPVSCTTLL